MLHGNVKTFDVIFKKIEESTRAVELALEGQGLFISGQKYNFKPELTGGGRVVRWRWVNFQYRGVLLWISVGQGPTALAVSADGGCLDIFSSSGRRPGRAIVLPPASALALVKF